MGIVTFVTMSLGGWGDGGFHRGILFILLFKETKILSALSSQYQAKCTVMGGQHMQANVHSG